jgi:anthranilate synthase
VTQDSYRTKGGVRVRRTVDSTAVDGAIDPILDALDDRRGLLFASSYEYPGRYTRWDMGFVDPPLEITVAGYDFAVNALNERGLVLLPAIAACLAKVDSLEMQGAADRFLTPDSRFSAITGRISPAQGFFPEEQRSRQPSAFTLIRALIDLFGSHEDPNLGLYGAFGYDLAFQFEPIRRKLERPYGWRDLVLYLPDRLVIVDHQRNSAAVRSYDFEVDGASTADLPRGGESRPYQAQPGMKAECDHAPGEYAAKVSKAREAFKRGDLFEVVVGQTFTEPSPKRPSELFRALRQRNPAPYGFLINLGRAEYLVGASPEMYVRVEGDRVETCPISGTIARGGDALGDAAQILELLNSEKDHAELTMCTDVDRNDKSRVCKPGSVRVIGRRQIELYSKLIHTVDHVEGHLLPGFDALDAFLTHTWAVTVTGAPKAWAMQFIEDHEKSARAWYGGAVGLVGFDGNMNTGLTLRTIHLKDGKAQVRVGATLLYDSVPDEEERETRLKASAFLDVLRSGPEAIAPSTVASTTRPGAGKRVLLVDYEDSFVHTLANYLRQTGADVVTLRHGFPVDELDRIKPDLLVLSPGPGQPSDFDVPGMVGAALARDLPVFGVCLGLQGIVEYFGGKLDLLNEPVHGKASCIRILGGGRLFDGFPPEFDAGRYHSLFARRESLPEELQILAESSDGVIMAVEHRSLPVAAVQFHPESILTLSEDVGFKLVQNVVANVAKTPLPTGKGGRGHK